ncbi:MAG: hypothetical protein ABIO82_07120, partial [Ginsengibacter sp.]
MKPVFYLFIFTCLFSLSSFADDTTNIPISRQVFHDKIKDEQRRADRMDGRVDGLMKVSQNNEVNLQVTDALIRQINVLRNDVESRKDLPTNNEKIRYLRYIESLLKVFTEEWKEHNISPALAPMLVENFSEIMTANIKGVSMAPMVNEVPYEVGLINSEIFNENPGYRESKILLFRKFCRLYPDKILSNLGPYVDEPFADSLVI